MKAFNFTDVKAERIEEDVQGTVTIRWLITKDIGAEHFAMRLFEVEPGSQAGPHSHAWEHEVFILEGNGVFKGDQEEFDVGPGNVIFIPPYESHQLKNNGKTVMKYLCMIPYLEK